MGRTSFDWRWIIVIAVALVFFGLLQIRLAPELKAVLLGLTGWWVLQAGLEPWRGRKSRKGGKEIYWRGQRMVIEQPRGGRWRTPPTVPLVSSVFYLVLCAGIWLATVRIVLGLFGV